MKNYFQSLFLLFGLISFMPTISYAHCDTMDGPVVIDAKMALEKDDVTPVLKWVSQKNEKQLKAIFNKTIKERSKGNKEKVDMKFFETLVKIHRTGEGAGFEGIKPAGTEVEPAIKEADKALENSSVDNLVSILTKEVTEGLKLRFAEVIEKKKHMNESVEMGREYVEAYVQFIHYAEKLNQMATSNSSGHHKNEHKNH